MSLAHRFIRRFYPYGSIRRVWRGPLKGTRYVVQPGLAATLALGLDNLNLKFLSTKIQPGQVVFDVGANQGQTSMFFARKVGPAGSVHAFEPVERNVEMLKKNISLNPMSNITPHQLALADKPGVRRFLFDPSRHTMGVFSDASVKLEDWESGFNVRCESIDSLLAQGLPRPDVLKIDVEGAGADVLHGAEKLLSQNPPAIYLELHALDRNAPEIGAVRELSEKWRYTITDVSGTLEDKPGLDWGAAVWCEPS
jgi:FkbM family methyltransferase